MARFPIKGEGQRRYVEFDNGRGTVYTIEVAKEFDPSKATNEEMQELLDRGRIESVPKTLTGRLHR